MLDVAAGSGDLARAFARRVGAAAAKSGSPTSTAACSRAAATACSTPGVLVPAVQCDAERLPFPTRTSTASRVGFGLRNMTHKDAALAEMVRVLKPGGRLLVLEFSQGRGSRCERAYDWYSFKVLPWLGERVAGDAAAYRYLAESIRMHPDQATLKAMMERAGLSTGRSTSISPPAWSRCIAASEL